MRDKYIVIKDIKPTLIIFKHPLIPVGTICEVVYRNGRYAIIFNNRIICYIGSVMEQTYFKRHIEQ